MFKNYLLIAMRTITRNRTVSFINIFGLAISMSICLLLILIVADQFSYDRFHSKKDRIYRIITKRTQLNEYVWETATTANPLKEYISQHTGIEDMTTVVRRFGGIASYGDRAISFEGKYAGKSFLNIFDFRLKQGNPEKALELPNSIILTNETAKKLFGDEDPLNKLITVENTGDFIVTGVMDEFPGKTHFYFDALASASFFTGQQADSSSVSNLQNWDNIYDSYLYVLMKEGAEPSDLSSALTDAATYNYEKEGEFSYEFIAQPLTGITPGPLLSNTMGFGLPDFFIYIMLGIALIVLLSACFNYSNLTTARAINRAKEIGVRKVVGARNRHVFFQFIIEAILVAIFSFVLADLAVQFLLPGLNNYLASLGAPVSFTETSGLYFWFILFVLLAGFLAGLFPAVFFSKTNPVEALRRTLRMDILSRRLGFRRLDIRKVLVVIQFTFTIIFVITLITIFQQTRYVMTMDHGFRSENLINIHLQGQDYESFKSGISNMSSVRSVASATYMPALGTNNTFMIYEENGEELFPMSYIGVDQGFIDIMGLDLISGSNFRDPMPATEQYLIVNEEMVREMGWEPADAPGQVIHSENGELEILGVIKDFHYERLDEKIGPMALRYKPEWANTAILSIDKSQQKNALQSIEEEWKVLTNRPFDYSYFEDDLHKSYGHFEALVIILGYVTIITVSIACLGLLGMVIYHIQNRTKELGIRKTLGASASSIMMTLGKGFVFQILISFLLASPVAYFINTAWLEMNAYRIDFGLSTFLYGLIAVLLIVGITVGGHIYRATQMNPVDSLRSE